MNSTHRTLPRAAAVFLIGGASLVAVIALVLVTLLLKPLASTAAGAQEMRIAPGDTMPMLNADPESHDGDTEPLGELPDGASPFDEEYAGILRLDQDLLAALRAASTDAAADGVRVQVNSGWRSAEYQARLYSDAVAEYGSAEEASRWVATPDTPAHVTGSAVDIGDTDATSWFSQFGAAYGLCQTYENEPWHYELRPEAVTEGCPAMSSDAAMH